MIYDMYILSETEKILYYIWIFLMIFIGISSIISVIHDNNKSEWRREGNKLIRICREKDQNLHQRL
jgi:hypothetical protein